MLDWLDAKPFYILHVYIKNDSSAMEGKGHRCFTVTANPIVKDLLPSWTSHKPIKICQAA